MSDEAPGLVWALYLWAPVLAFAILGLLLPRGGDR